MSAIAAGKRIHAAYERRAKKRWVMYTAVPWEALPDASRREFIDIAQAAIDGHRTHNGHRIPGWVRHIAKETP